MAAKLTTPYQYLSVSYSTRWRPDIPATYISCLCTCMLLQRNQEPHPYKHASCGHVSQTSGHPPTAHAGCADGWASNCSHRRHWACGLFLCSGRVFCSVGRHSSQPPGCAVSLSADAQGSQSSCTPPGLPLLGLVSGCNVSQCSLQLPVHCGCQPGYICIHQYRQHVHEM